MKKAINEQARYLCQIRDSLQFDMIPTGIREFITNHQDLEMDDKFLFLNVIWPDAQRTDNFVMRTGYDALMSITKRSHKTVQRILRRLEAAGLIAREMETFGQKTYLKSLIVSLPVDVLEKVLIKGKRRKNVSKLLISTNSDQSPQVKNDQLITRSVRQDQRKQLITDETIKTENYSKLTEVPISETVDVVFNKNQQATIMEKLNEMKFSGTSAKKLLAEIAFSLRGGQWKCGAGKALDIIFQRIKSNTWTTPYYFESTPGTESFAFTSQTKQAA